MRFKTHYNKYYDEKVLKPLEGGEIIQAEYFKEYINSTDYVLDFGCGRGNLTAEIVCREKQGVEINPESQEYAKSKIKCVYADIKEVPENYFDKIISNHALEHVFNPLGILKSLYEKLKKGGQIILIVPIDDWRSKSQSTFHANDIHQHLHNWTPQSLGNLLTLAGFKVIKVDIISKAWSPKILFLKQLPFRLFDFIQYVFALLKKKTPIKNRRLKGMIILFIVNGSFNKNFKNFNYYQRSFSLAKYADITLSVRNDYEISNEISCSCKVIKGRYKGKFGHLLNLIKNISMLTSYDMVITEASIFSIFGFLSKTLFGKTWILDIWDIPFRNLKKNFLSRMKREFQVFIFRPLFHNADLFIVSIIPDFQLREFRLPAHKIKLYANAISLNEYKKLPQLTKFNVFTILIQRSVFYKGFGLEFMLKAFSIILDNFEARLIIAGHIQPVVLIEINKCTFRDKIELRGFIPHIKFNELALKSHICAIPFPQILDLEQTYPIKAIEYMALGKAIVATKIAGLEKLIGEAGVLVNPITPENFAIEIINLYNDPGRIAILEKKAKKRSLHFDANKKNKMIFLEIEKLMNAC